MEFSETSLDVTDLRLLNALQHNSARSNQALAHLLHLSPPTCLRRVRRLRELGLIEKEVAVLASDKLAQQIGHGLSAIVEVSLDRQDAQALDDFEDIATTHVAVQQCWRVSPGPDFVLIVTTSDMPSYLELTQQLFTSNANVRNVKSFFATKRAKFGSAIPLDAAIQTASKKEL